ncbi:hypothetical protein AB0J42_31045 [Nonomuraea sp. NPDC049649]|uniref:hypothetical protein n=1 Tax=Nonomuraea sp. NPDC049649 TaxID=3155776 RepID=UPI0034447FB1
MSAGLLRVVWVPGSDLLRGVCHCGATHVADGPIEVWDWLLAHPHGHEPPLPDHASPASRVLPSRGASP